MNEMYYFVPKMGSDDKLFKLLKPFRIVRISDAFPLKPNGVKGYKTIKDLRKNDFEWIEYYRQDPKSAVKITEEIFILTPEYFVLLPMDDPDFNNISYKLLKHTVMGELSDDIMGIHLISRMNSNIKSVRQTAVEDLLGVWKADIEYYSKERNKVFLKKDSTMFPKYWDPTTFMFKMYGAYQTKKQCKLDDSIFHSFTNCGIPVDFVIRNNDLKTVYPIYQKIEL